MCERIFYRIFCSFPSKIFIQFTIILKIASKKNSSRDVRTLLDDLSCWHVFLSYLCFSFCSNWTEDWRQEQVSGCAHHSPFMRNWSSPRATDQLLVTCVRRVKCHQHQNFILGFVFKVLSGFYVYIVQCFCKCVVLNLSFIPECEKF